MAINIKHTQKDRLQSLNQGISYLKDQINLYKELSYNSLKEAQGFAIKNDLTTLKDLKSGDDEIINFIDIERIRMMPLTELDLSISN